MGLVKSEWMESEERGWSAKDTFVCARCISDDYLKEIIRVNVTCEHCDYCGRRSKQKSIAAPLAALIEPIAAAFFRYFADPTQAGVPRDSGEWVGEESFVYTEDALLSLPLECRDELLPDIVDSFDNCRWYPCADGFWLHSHQSETLGYAWDKFVEQVKYKNRYFLFHKDIRQSRERDDDEYEPINLLKTIGRFAFDHDLIKVLEKGTTLFRVRNIPVGKKLKGFKEVGPPPKEFAGAGRMNPAGISYCYLSLQKRTALAEVTARQTEHSACASFKTIVDLRLLDLSELAPLPSVFDSDNYEKRQNLLFLTDFVDAIMKPTKKDGREHIDYVPSQVVSEYFALCIGEDTNDSLHGIIYPSAAQRRGKNIVLFPSRQDDNDWEEILALSDIQYIKRHSFDI